MILCPGCGAKSHVTETRRAPYGVRRRLKCLGAMCGRTFGTIEVVSDGLPDLAAIKEIYANKKRTA